MKSPQEFNGGAQGAQCDHVLQLSDKSHGDERGRRVFTRCTTVRQSSKAVVPTASFHERVDVQLRTLGDQITHVSLELTPTQSMLMQIKQRLWTR